MRRAIFFLVLAIALCAVGLFLLLDGRGPRGRDEDQAGDLDVTLAPGETREATVRLGASGSIRGKVVMAGSQERVSGALVHAERSDGSHAGLRSLRDCTDDYGDFWPAPVPEGPVVLVASDLGYPPARMPGVVVPRDGTVEVTIELRPGVGLHGFVTRGDRSVPGAQVTARSADGQLRREVRAARNGSYEIPDLPPGDYKLLTEAPRYDGTTQRFERTATVVEDIYLGVDIDLEKVQLHGRILSGGSPVEEAKVSVSRPDGRRLGSARMYASGAYWLTVLRAEKYVLRVSTSGRRPLELELTVQESAGEVHRDIELGSR